VDPSTKRVGLPLELPNVKAEFAELVKLTVVKVVVKHGLLRRIWKLKRAGLTVCEAPR